MIEGDRYILEFLSQRPKIDVLTPMRSTLLRLRAGLDGRTPSTAAFKMLNERRILSSQSLVSEQQNRAHWDAANHLLAVEATEGHRPGLESLCRLNAVLTGSSGGFRAQPVFAGGFRYPSPDLFPAALDILKAILLDDDALTRAALSYIWVSNIHPFENGNGRTGRLFADATLIQNGFLPLCFPTAAAAHVCRGYAENDFSLEECILRCWRGIEESFQILGA